MPFGPKETCQQAWTSGSMPSRSLTAFRNRCLQPKYALGRLNGDIAWEQLNLLQLAARRSATPERRNHEALGLAYNPSALLIQRMHYVLEVRDSVHGGCDSCGSCGAV